MDGYRTPGLREYHSANYRDALSEYLQTFQWHVFYTITFRKPRKDSIYHGNQIWNYLYEHSPMERLFLISEPHTTGYLHFHGIGKYFGRRFEDELCRGLQAEEDSEKLFVRYGINEVTPIRMHEQVSSYLTKYVAKSIDAPAIDYNFYGKWTRELPIKAND